jgi:hypothetical protein
MHRPLPGEANIKGAKVIRYRIADRERWELHLTLEVAKEHRLFGSDSRRYGSFPGGEKCGDGAVFVNFGWREKDNGRRVAYIRDEDGYEEEILVESEVVSGLRKVDDLVSIRKRTLNEMVGQLWTWRKSQKTPPLWFADRTTHLYEWVSARKFVSLLRAWEKDRWEGDDEGFRVLKEWADGVWREDLPKRSGKMGRMDGSDKHLWQWEDSQRKKSIRRRKHQYRNVAARLARRYAVLVVESWDMGLTKRRKPVGSNEVEIRAAKRALQQTAAGELRECMVQAFWARGGRVVKVDPVRDTQRCNVCGFEEKWDAAPKVEHTCEGCGSTWDQDSNNVRNIEFKFCAMKVSGDATGEGGPKKRDSKWAQRRKKKEEAAQRRKEREQPQPDAE